MAKLRPKHCPKCECEQFWQIETKEEDGKWQDVWTCVECGRVLYFDTEEEA